jgi:hypothetical protein
MCNFKNSNVNSKTGGHSQVPLANHDDLHHKNLKVDNKKNNFNDFNMNSKAKKSATAVFNIDNTVKSGHDQMNCNFSKDLVKKIEEKLDDPVESDCLINDNDAIAVKYI